MYASDLYLFFCLELQLLHLKNFLYHVACEVAVTQGVTENAFDYMMFICLIPQLIMPGENLRFSKSRSAITFWSVTTCLIFHWISGLTVMLHHRHRRNGRFTNHNKNRVLTHRGSRSSSVVTFLLLHFFDFSMFSTNSSFTKMCFLKYYTQWFQFLQKDTPLTVMLSRFVNSDLSCFVYAKCLEFLYEFLSKWP